MALSRQNHSVRANFWLFLKMSLKSFVKNDKNVAFFYKSLGLGPGLGWATVLGLGLGWLTWSRSRYTSGLGLGKEILVSVDPWKPSRIQL